MQGLTASRTALLVNAGVIALAPVRLGRLSLPTLCPSVGRLVVGGCGRGEVVMRVARATASSCVASLICAPVGVEGSVVGSQVGRGRLPSSL